MYTSRFGQGRSVRVALAPFPTAELQDRQCDDEEHRCASEERSHGVGPGDGQVTSVTSTLVLRSQEVP